MTCWQKFLLPEICGSSSFGTICFIYNFQIFLNFINKRFCPEKLLFAEHAKILTGLRNFLKTNIFAGTFTIKMFFLFIHFKDLLNFKWKPFCLQKPLSLQCDNNLTLSLTEVLAEKIFVSNIHRVNNYFKYLNFCETLAVFNTNTSRIWNTSSVNDLLVWYPEKYHCPVIHIKNTTFISPRVIFRCPTNLYKTQ